MNKTGFLAPLIFLLSLIVGPTSVFATHSPFVSHTTSPMTARNINMPQTTTVAAKVQNNSPMGISTPLCATDLMGGRKMHLGCVPNFDFSAAGAGQSMFAFDLTRVFTPGMHTVVFTYRDPMGNWHEVMTANHTPQRTTFTQ